MSCFTPGTLIQTPNGATPIETLGAGDLVVTLDGGAVPIRWHALRGLTGAELQRRTHMRPVQLKAGAIQSGVPMRDTLVSPNQKVLVRNTDTALYFEDSEILLAAKHLTGLEGVDIVDVPWATYVLILLDQPQVVLSNGCWSEVVSAEALSRHDVGNAQRLEVLELFPELAAHRSVPSGAGQGERMRERHQALHL